MSVMIKQSHHINAAFYYADLLRQKNHLFLSRRGYNYIVYMLIIYSLIHVVVIFIVASQRDLGTQGQAIREENLRGCLNPDLQYYQYISVMLKTYNSNKPTHENT